MRVYFFFLKDGYRSFVLLHEKQITKSELAKVIEEIPNLYDEDSKHWLMENYGFVDAKETLIDLDDNEICMNEELKEGDET